MYMYLQENSNNYGIFLRKKVKFNVCFDCLFTKFTRTNQKRRDKQADTTWLRSSLPALSESQP